MAKIIHLSGSGGMKRSMMKSLLKKRSTFWQMMGCMLRFKYRPSLLLIVVFLLLPVYLLTSLDLFSSDSILLGHLDEAVLVFLFIKLLMHETMRFTRYKALCRKC